MKIVEGESYSSLISIGRNGRLIGDINGLIVFIDSLKSIKTTTGSNSYFTKITITTKNEKSAVGTVNAADISKIRQHFADERQRIIDEQEKARQEKIKSLQEQKRLEKLHQEIDAKRAEKALCLEEFVATLPDIESQEELLVPLEIKRGLRGDVYATPRIPDGHSMFYTVLKPYRKKLNIIKLISNGEFVLDPQEDEPLEDLLEEYDDEDEESSVLAVRIDSVYESIMSMVK